MRLLVCAGATGGGINPALAVLEALDNPIEDTLWVGSIGGMEEDLVHRAGIPYKAIPAGGIHGVGLLKLTSSLVKLTKGYFAARKIIQDFKPDVLFFTGGYVAIPVGLAGRKIPTVVCLPDIEPALAIRTLSRFADHIAVPAEASKAYFSSGKQITVTGYPTRKSLTAWEKDKAISAFNLSPDKPILFITGGSLGSRSINQAIVAILPDLLTKMQVIHATGKFTWPEVETAVTNLPEDLRNNYRVYPYLHDRMGAAFSIADLVISRAGASILGEYPLFGFPAILVPYPHAWRYQIVNADFLASSGAAVVVKDEDLNSKLLAAILNIMDNKPNRDQMRTAMRFLSNSEAARRIADIIHQTSSSQPSSKGNAS